MFKSADGHWTVTPITRDGHTLLRVEHDTALLAPGRCVPVHWDGTHRCGVTRTGRGFLVADVSSAGDVARWVDLSALREVR